MSVLPGEKVASRTDLTSMIAFMRRKPGTEEKGCQKGFDGKWTFEGVNSVSSVD
jgi:hypothetical protein